MRKKCCPSPSPWLVAVLWLPFCLHTAHGTPVHPADHLDSMGSYHLTNQLQCQNLCRYHRLCERYSYQFLEAPGSEEDNCVIHADSVAAAALPSGWEDYTPPSTGSTTGCLGQPCGDSEFCVRSQSVSHYSCLQIPIECSATIAVTNGYGDISGRQQDDVANVYCNPHFMFFPRGADFDTVTCLVTSQWTDPSRECKQIIFENPAVPFTVELPEIGVVDGWSVCILATFAGTTRFTVNFFQGVNGADSAFQVDFRHSFSAYPSTGLIWDTSSSGSWAGNPQFVLNSSPLAPYSSINLTFRATGGLLEVVLNDDAPMTIDVAGRVDLSLIDRLNLKNDWAIDSVSLYHTC